MVKSSSIKISSKNMLEIENENVTLYRRGDEDKSRRKIKQIPVSAFLGEVRDSVSDTWVVETPPLPEGVFYYGCRGSVETVVLEQQPGIRTVRWSQATSDETRRRGGTKTYALAFPYIVLICRMARKVITDVHVFYRTAPLNSLEDELLCTNLSNVFDTRHRICLGGVPFSGSLKDQVERALDRLWNSGFNADLGGGEFVKSKKLDKRISSLRAWEAASKKDEFFMLKVDWETAYKTLKGAIQALCFGGAALEKAISTMDDLLDIFYRCAPESREKPSFFYQRQTPEKIEEYPEDYHDMPSGGGGCPCG